MPKNMTLTDEQVLVLKAAWEYFIEDDGHVEAMAEALEISYDERGMDEDGEYVGDRDEGSDPVVKRINELGLLIQNL